MTRFSGVLVALLLFTSSLSGSTAIAPLPPHIGSNPYDDGVGRSATNGEATLAVWTNASSLFAATWGVYGRLMARDGVSGPAFSIGRGMFPRVATNGTDFLVAYSVAASRFNVYPFDNVFVQVVRADGSLDAPRAIHQSLSSRVESVIWTGTHWLVGYAGPEPRVALLDPSLSARSIALDGSGAPQLAAIGNRWWAFVTTATGVSAIEILANGGTGARREITGVSLKDVIEAPDGARLIVADSVDTRVAIFDGEAFSTPATLFAAPLFRDAAWWNGSLIVLHRDANGSTLHAAIVDADGEVGDRVELADDLDHLAYPPTIEPSAEGLMLFAAVPADAAPGAPTDLFALRIRSLQPVNVSERERVSEIDISTQQDPLIASNGTDAVAFWNQTIDDAGTLATFSRMFDADGAPVSDPVRLPFSFTQDADVVFAGDHFVLAWAGIEEVFAISVSADGKTAGRLELLGPALPFFGDPAIATSTEGTFVVWRDPGFMVRGTPIREDGSPAVPGGFELLPTLGSWQGVPEIVAIDEGFLVLWTNPDIHSVTISAAGTVRSLTSLDGDAARFTAAHAGSSTLIAWTRPQGSILYAFSGDGRPFEAFDPHWGQWTPLAIIPRGADRYFVAIERQGIVSTTEIEMQGAFITRVASLRRFTPLDTSEGAIADLGGSPLVIAREGKRLFVLTAPEIRRRAARH